MDDIAREMGISKKTIYQYFENKDDLVNQWTKNFLGQLCISMEKIAGLAKNAIEESLMNEKNFVTMFTKMSPSVFHDLKKYYPAVNSKVKDFEKETITFQIERMIQRGMDENIFRPDLEIALVTKIHFLTMDLCFDPNHFPQEKFNLTKILPEIQNMFLRGICNERGLILLNHYRSEASKPIPSL